MGSDAVSGLNKVGFEKQWANHEARLRLSKDDKALWNSCQYTVRPFVYFDKVLIAWTLHKGEPQVKEIFKVVALDVSFQDGVWMRMRAEIAKRDVHVTHSPRRLLDLEVFAWVPYFNEMRFTSANWNDLDAPKNLRLTACFKMTSHPLDSSLVEGRDYLMELHVFRERWPQYANTRF